MVQTFHIRSSEKWPSFASVGQGDPAKMATQDIRGNSSFSAKKLSWFAESCRRFCPTTFLKSVLLGRLPTNYSFNYLNRPVMTLGPLSEFT